MTVVFFLRQRKNLSKLLDRKIVIVRQSIGMGRISRRNNRRPKLSYRLKVDCRERGER